MYLLIHVFYSVNTVELLRRCATGRCNRIKKKLTKRRDEINRFNQSSDLNETLDASKIENFSRK